MRHGAELQPYPQLIEAVMMLWRRGENTADIAARWLMPESVIHRALIMGREAV